MNPVLTMESVSKRFGRTTALDEVTLELPAGSVTALLGPNGAGKSTLLRAALGCLAPDRGRTRVLGLDPLAAPADVRRATGYVPDRADAPGWMSARELFRFLRPHYPTWGEARARATLERRSIDPTRRLDALSRGQQAFVMLAAALAPAPRLLLCDEPFSALDPLARDELLGGLIAELGEGTSLLVATHDLDVAARLADRVVVLARGRVAAAGSLAEVLGEDGPPRLPRRLFDLLEEVAA